MTTADDMRLDCSRALAIESVLLGRMLTGPELAAALRPTRSASNSPRRRSVRSPISASHKARRTCLPMR